MDAKEGFFMTGTSKAILSMCVLLLAALVVYYGMTPPEATTDQSVNRPAKRPSMFGGDPEKKLLQLGIPPVAADVIRKPESVTISIEPTITDEVVVVETIIEQVQEESVHAEVPELSFTLYQVKEGETLGEIAIAELGSFNMWKEIASINNISNPRNIRPGRTLKMPKRKSTKTIAHFTTVQVPEGTMTHRVADGDTLSSIAGDYYGDVNKYDWIARANPSVDPNRLSIGTILVIPKR